MNPSNSNDNGTSPERPAGFPYFTALASLAGLFLFVGLVLLMYDLPNPLGESQLEQHLDPVEKFKAVQSRNEPVLNGTDPTVKMSNGESTAALLDRAAKSKNVESPHGRLPFPVEPRMP